MGVLAAPYSGIEPQPLLELRGGSRCLKPTKRAVAHARELDHLILRVLRKQRDGLLIRDALRHAQFVRLGLGNLGGGVAAF